MVAERLQAATSKLTPPFALVDLDALDSNAESMITRAHGLPIRLATKSIRCRAVVDRVLGRGGFHGILVYSLAEAIWLARSGISDVLLAYPTVDCAALADRARDDQLRGSIMVMVDSVKHCEINH
jgi:D-serine deaminase-like pyridoxal phosphate-dependent protein